jgi:hypothetical protein
MKIGYSVEGSTDRALLTGLRDRWCPRAELVAGRFRGQSGQSQRREIPNTCLELCSKGAEIIVFMRDSNNGDWRDVRKADTARCRIEHQHITVFAVCQRNVECWICSDQDWIAKRLGGTVDEFRAEDPKPVFESRMAISSKDRKESDIAGLVRDAPLKQWLANKSFEAFYDDIWQQSKTRNCAMENIKDSPS